MMISINFIFHHKFIMDIYNDEVYLKYLYLDINTPQQIVEDIEDLIYNSGNIDLKNILNDDFDQLVEYIDPVNFIEQHSLQYAIKHAKDYPDLIKRICHEVEKHFDSFDEYIKSNEVYVDFESPFYYVEFPEQNDMTIEEQVFGRWIYDKTMLIMLEIYNKINNSS